LIVVSERLDYATAPDVAGLNTEHRLFISGAADADAAERLRQRWRGLVDITEADGGRAADRGLVLVRPDGYVGCRSPSSDAAALEALDAHLASYLIPA
jgi:hypothetical protein